MRLMIAAFGIALAAMMATGCNHVTPPTPPPPPPPPPSSSSASAQVDGAAWNANTIQNDVIGARYWLAVDAEGHPIEKHWGFITFGQLSNNPRPGEVATAIGIQFWGEMAPGTIELGGPRIDTPGHGNGFWSVIGGSASEEWATDAEHKGTLTITAVDEANHRVRGTFEFVAWSAEQGTEVRIQRGAFEGTYIDQDRPTESLR